MTCIPSGKIPVPAPGTPVQITLTAAQAANVWLPFIGETIRFCALMPQDFRHRPPGLWHLLAFSTGQR